MPRSNTAPLLTPGDHGGGAPVKPEPEESKPDLPPYIYPSVPPKPPPPPPPIPQPQPDLPHDNADRPVPPPPPPPTEQSTGQASSSDSGEQGSKDSSQTGDAPDAGHGKGETLAQEVLPDIGEAEENRIDPADIKFYLAARHNPVLKELQLIFQHENIPSPWRDRPDLVLSLCAEYGIDEENDAEAKAFLDDFTNGDAYQQRKENRKEDPLNDAWREAHEVYDPAAGDRGNSDKQAIVDYRAQIATTYGVKFASEDGANDWDLLRARMVHVGLEMAAAALGSMAREMGLDWDDETAFRRIIGDINLILSGTSHPRKALAEVDGRDITFYWNSDTKRMTYPLPNLLLHELGHVFNANAGLGDREGSGSINKTTNHPDTWMGMGSPYPSILTPETRPKTVVTFDEEWMEDVMPLHDIIGLDKGDKLFSGVKLTVDQILRLRQSWAEGDTNEITADAFLNWVFHRNTGGAIGFMDYEKGQEWQKFMNDNMDEWIRNAVVHNALRENSNIAFFVESGVLPHFAGFTTVARAGVNVRTEPTTAEGDDTVVRSLSKGDEVAVIGQTEGGFNGVDRNWTAIIWNGRKRWVASYLLERTQNVPSQVDKEDSFFDFDPSGTGEEEWELFFRLASYLDQGVANAQ